MTRVERMERELGAMVRISSAELDDRIRKCEQGLAAGQERLARGAAWQARRRSASESRGSSQREGTGEESDLSRDVSITRKNRVARPHYEHGRTGEPVHR